MIPRRAASAYRQVNQAREIAQQFLADQAGRQEDEHRQHQQHCDHDRKLAAADIGETAAAPLVRNAAPARALSLAAVAVRAIS